MFGRLDVEECEQYFAESDRLWLWDGTRRGARSPYAAVTRGNLATEGVVVANRQAGV